MANVRNWRTSLGGSIQSVGTSFQGFALTVGFTNMEMAERYHWMIPLGFILKVVGEQVSALFGADAHEVAKNLADQKDINRETDLFTGRPNNDTKPDK